MTVLHIVPATPFGGLQRLAALLASEQKRSGLDVQLLALYSDPEFQALLEGYELPHTFLGGSGPRFRTIRQLRRMVSREWSVIHIHGGLLWSNAVALFAKRSPVVFHAHNYPPGSDSLKSWALNRVNQSLVDVVLAVSNDVARAWRATNIGSASAIECVYNSVELPKAAKRERLPLSPESPVFGMATRLAKDKGLFEFVEVASEIHTERPGARFIIAGEGPEKRDLESSIKSRGLDEVFALPGLVRDLDEFWSSVNVALFSAPREPFGLRILEAMVRGVPVAGYLTGAGSDEILCSDTTAVTAQFPDAKVLAQAALNLCDDPSLYAKIVRAAHDDVANRFSVAAMRESVMRAYETAAQL
jgi:glycosyltransferase involved in cell wall biosynthesis